MLTIDQIMDREKRDMYFIDFNGHTFGDTPAKKLARTEHFKWFKQNNLTVEVAAPDGWLEGDPGIYAVYFDGPHDPRVAAYASLFEDVTGTISLNPKAYQMKLITCQSWLDNDGPARLVRDLSNDDW
jgi:predicted Zn-dependent protease